MGQASDYGTAELLRWCEANRQSASDVNDLTLMNEGLDEQIALLEAGERDMEGANEDIERLK